MAQILAPLLGGIGKPIIPEVRRVLDSNDMQWKCWILQCIVSESQDVAFAFQEDLRRLANTPLPEETLEDLNQIAKDILEKFEIT